MGHFGDKSFPAIADRRELNALTSDLLSDL